ncbi:hypothetical protein [Nonomuraea sp. NPDC002799]
MLAVGLGVLLLGGGTVGTVTYLSASDPETPAALPSAPPTFPPTAPPQFELPSPSAEPSDEVAEPDAEPTDTPPTSSRAVPGSPISDNEFDDWRFELGDVKFDANKAGGWTYDTCDPVDGQGVMAKNNCERALQIAYSAYRGHLKAVQVLLSFPTEKAAKATATRLTKLSSNAVNVRSDMTLPNFTYGKFFTGAFKKYVVITIVTADKTARSKAAKFHLYLQADTAGYLLLRDRTLTS